MALRSSADVRSGRVRDPDGMVPNNQTRRPGSLDGAGAADCDMPYRFGLRPHAEVPFPFSTRQYARLLILRSRIRAAHFAADGALGW